MTFTPTLRVFEPPLAADPLGEALVRGLNRRANRRRPWGIARTFIGAGISLGLIPLIIWPTRFLDSANFVYRQMDELVDWLSLQRGEDQIAPAREALRRARFSTMAAIQIWILAAGIFFLIAEYFLKSGFDLRALLHATYGREFWWGGTVSSPKQSAFHWCWTFALCLAFLLHSLHIAGHAARMENFLKKVNPIFVAAGQEAVSWPGPGLGMTSIWLPLGVVCAVFGAWWAIPAAVAGAIHKRYVWGTTTDFRRELANRVDSMMSNKASDA